MDREKIVYNPKCKSMPLPKKEETDTAKKMKSKEEMYEYLSRFK